ncbi:MAG: ElyC/SanA/YdcF family protein [Acutalibacteraceae bacterium]|nr:ElyC/SanA/YdcF family protein [Acutalibacteraceae bacterium]
MKRKGKRIITVLISAAVLLLAVIFVPNFIVVGKVKNDIISLEEAESLADTDCAVILGAGVRNGEPTPMLKDRLLTGIDLYKSGAVKKLIMGGDHGSKDYDEVNIMKSFAVDNGVPDEDIFMDHAGFSTYETVYRAKEIFEADNIIIVSQKYHLYRALYIAEKLDVKAVGVSADLRTYSGQKMRDLREILARDKDFFNCIIKPEPTYLGEKIPVSGNGNLTND